MDQCPLCNAERVPGEEYCLSPGCGYHFKDLTQSEPHSQTEEVKEKQEEVKEKQEEVKEKQESTAQQPDHSFQQTDDEWVKNKKENEKPQGILVLPDKKIIPLEDDLRTVGRGDVMQFVGALNGPDPYLVSRQQFTIWRVAVTSGESPYHYFIEDAKNSIQEKSSGNGTRVNDEKITGQPKRMLQDGDKIQFAEIKDCVAIFQIK
jgi:hypothetical protein